MHLFICVTLGCGIAYHARSLVQKQVAGGSAREQRASLIEQNHED